MAKKKAKVLKGGALSSKKIEDGFLKKRQQNSIGYFGKWIIFKTKMDVSDAGCKATVLTFNNFRKEVSSTTTLHKRVGKKPKSEFTGPELATISFDMVLLASLGVKPREMIEKIEKCCEQGIVGYLVIGGKKVSKNKFRIKSASESWDEVYRDGNLYQATVSVSMEEYI